MSRFHLSNQASTDLDEIATRLKAIPLEPALRIGKALQNALNRLASYPGQGHLHDRYSNLSQEPVRSAVCGDYVILYAALRQPVLFLGIIHGKRDVNTIMRERLT